MYNIRLLLYDIIKVSIGLSQVCFMRYIGYNQIQMGTNTHQFIMKPIQFVKKIWLRPNKNICVFQVSRPYLGFCPDPKHFIVNCEQNGVKFAGKWGKIYWTKVKHVLSLESFVFISFHVPQQFYQDGPRIEAAFRKYFHRADVDETKDSYEIIVCHANVIRYFVCRLVDMFVL